VAPRAQVVVLSGIDSHAVLDDARARGAAACFAKDSDLDGLLASLEAMVQAMVPPDDQGRPLL
jgi:DNA-binding NarL/FixJ family response regulator